MSLEKVVSFLPVDSGKFAVDLRGFFKFCAARREDYVKVGELTEVCSPFICEMAHFKVFTCTCY